MPGADDMARAELEALRERGLLRSLEPLRTPPGAEVELRPGERSFQELVGGLGFGPALDLSRCEFSFDPRLCPGCPADLGPVPAGRCF